MQLFIYVNSIAFMDLCESPLSNPTFLWSESCKNSITIPVKQVNALSTQIGQKVLVQAGM